MEMFWETVRFVSPEDIKSDSIGVVSNGNVKELIKSLLQSDIDELEKKLSEMPKISNEDNEIFIAQHNTYAQTLRNIIQEKQEQLECLKANK